MSASALVTLPRMEGDDGAGARIAARRKGLGLGTARLAELAGVSRPHLSEVQGGHTEPSPEWLRRVELAMDRYEHETGQDEPSPKPELTTEQGIVEFEVSGDFGVRVVVRGPIADTEELERSVTRLIRNIRESQGGEP